MGGIELEYRIEVVEPQASVEPQSFVEPQSLIEPRSCFQSAPSCRPPAFWVVAPSTSLGTSRAPFSSVLTAQLVD